MKNQSEKLAHQVGGLPSPCLASSRIQFSVHTRVHRPRQGARAVRVRLQGLNCHSGETPCLPWRSRLSRTCFLRQSGSKLPRSQRERGFQHKATVYGTAASPPRGRIDAINGLARPTTVVHPTRALASPLCGPSELKSKFKHTSARE
jgi:hypothetical protein